MNRFELNPKWKEGYDYHGRSYKNWDPTPGEIEMFDWLIANIGDYKWGYFEVPCVGDGWKIYLCHRDDEDMTAYGWSFSDLSYRGKGPLGYWLDIEDDQKAIEFKLSGIYERACWLGDQPHHDFNIGRLRRERDPDNYPKWRVRYAV